MTVVLALLVGVLAVVGAFTLGFVFWLRWKIGRVGRAALEQAAREAAVVEHADWFGSTGLGDETERELPRYLRRELGQSVHDLDALKANDLRYLGAFTAPRGGQVHFWHMPHGRDPDVFAYVETGEEEGDGCFGWGDRQPPPLARIA